MRSQDINPYRAADVAPPNYDENRDVIGNTLWEMRVQSIVKACAPVIFFALGFVTTALQESQEQTKESTPRRSIPAMIPQESTWEHQLIVPRITFEEPKPEFMYHVEGIFSTPFNGDMLIETDIRSEKPLSFEELEQEFRKKARKILHDRINPPMA